MCCGSFPCIAQGCGPQHRMGSGLSHSCLEQAHMGTVGLKASLKR